MPQQTEELLTTLEVAKLLGEDSSQVRYLLRQRVKPAGHRGRSPLYDSEAVAMIRRVLDLRQELRAPQCASS